MRTFRSRDNHAADLAGARKEVESLQASLDRARSELEAKDREIRELTAAVKRLEIRQADMKQGGDFIESHGVFWQRAAGGHVDALAYCPTCRLVMTPLPSGYPEYMVCTHCAYRAPFHPEAIPSIMDELSGPDPVG